MQLLIYIIVVFPFLITNRHITETTVIYDADEHKPAMFVYIYQKFSPFINKSSQTTLSDWNSFYLVHLLAIFVDGFI